MNREATITSDIEYPAIVASAVRPDNTSEMETKVENGRIITHIQRESTSGLQSTVDDYVANLRTAMRIVQLANQDTEITTNHE
ncbi:MAG: KEOPS complex subunit Pcc1 [Halobacteriaceae archaeon]